MNMWSVSREPWSVSRKNGQGLTAFPYFIYYYNKLFKVPANPENKGCSLGLTWAGTEARPTEKGFFSRNQKPETGNHSGMPALRTPL